MKIYTVVINGKSFEVEILDIDSGKAKVMVDGVEINADILEANEDVEISDESIDRNIVEDKINEESFVPSKRGFEPTKHRHRDFICSPFWCGCCQWNRNKRNGRPT